MGSFNKIDYTIADGRSEILLNRPDVMNAYDEEMLTELDTAVSEAMSDSAVHVIILSGRGRAFCSGVDLDTTSDHIETRQSHEEHRMRVDSVYRLLHKGSKPTIAAVNGPAIGAGFGFALSCDFRIISEDTFMRDHHLNVGLSPSVGAGWLLPRLIGVSKAKEFVLLSGKISPEEAEDCGLVTDVVKPGETMIAARKLADQLKTKPVMAMQSAIELMNIHQSFEEYVQSAAEWQWKCKNQDRESEVFSTRDYGRSPDRGKDSE